MDKQEEIIRAKSLFMKAHNASKDESLPAEERERHRSNAKIFHSKVKEMEMTGGEQAVQMVKNIPGSAAGVAKDVWQMVRHPIETAGAMQSLSQGVVEKMLPSEHNGVEFGPTDNEQLADSVGGMYKDRYGSVDKARSTMINDPVGMGLDLFGLGTGATMTTAKAANLAAKAVPENMPRDTLVSALRFRPGVNKHNRNARNEIAQTMLDENIPATQAGVNKGFDTIGTIMDEVDALIQSVPAWKEIPKAQVYRYFDDLRAKIGGPELRGGENLKAIDDVVAKFDEHMASLGKDTLTPIELQNFKKRAYESINFDKQSLPGTATEGGQEAYSTAAKAAREIIGGFDETHAGDLHKLNAREGKLIEAMKEIPSVAQRMDNYRGFGADAMVKTLMGGALGSAGGSKGAGIGAALGTGASILTHPRTVQRTAFLLDALRKSKDGSQKIVNKTITPSIIAAALESGQLGDFINE